jgi:hypothetical protein
MITDRMTIFGSFGRALTTGNRRPQTTFPTWWWYQIHSFYGKSPVVACVTCGATKRDEHGKAVEPNEIVTI